jgi:hypothetical protein
MRPETLPREQRQEGVPHHRLHLKQEKRAPEDRQMEAEPPDTLGHVIVDIVE